MKSGNIFHLMHVIDTQRPMCFSVTKHFKWKEETPNYAPNQFRIQDDWVSVLKLIQTAYCQNVNILKWPLLAICTSKDFALATIHAPNVLRGLHFLRSLLHLVLKCIDVHSIFRLLTWWHLHLVLTCVPNVYIEICFWLLCEAHVASSSHLHWSKIQRQKR